MQHWEKLKKKLTKNIWRLKNYVGHYTAHEMNCVYYIWAKVKNVLTWGFKNRIFRFQITRLCFCPYMRTEILFQNLFAFTLFGLRDVKVVAVFIFKKFLAVHYY